MRGTSQPIATGVHEFAGVLLHMQALNADLLEVGVFALFGHLHFDPTLFSDRFVVLGDLVVLWEIGIEVLLAIELAVFSDVQVQRHRSLHGVLEHLLIQHRQGARQTAHHRINVGIGIVTKGGGGGGEDLAVGAELHVGLKTDHGFPSLFRCCRCRHPL